MGVIPDKFILLNQDDQETSNAVVRNLGEAAPALDEEQRERIARNAVLEYNLQMRGV